MTDSVVLVVDDERANREVLRVRLRHAGYTVLIAEGGSQALELIEQHTVDVVLLDIMMPGMDGIEVARRMRATGRRTPIIAITASQEREIRLEALEAGVDEFLHKPIDTVELAIRLKNQLRLKRATDALEAQNLRLDDLATRRAQRWQALMSSIPARITELDRRGEIAFINRSGEHEDVGISWLDSGGPSSRGSRREVFEQVLSTAENTSFHHSEELPGGRRRWWTSQVGPIRRGEETVGVVISSLDVTAMRETEERLRQARKMEAIGALAGGIAHDFNNLLTVIQAFTGFVREDLPEEHPGREDLDMVLQAADGAAKLTKQLLSFSRKRVEAPRLIDLNQAVQNISMMLGRSIGERHNLSIHPCAESAQVLMDPWALDQILINLSVNARDAMPDGGTIALRVNIEPRGADGILQEGDYAVLAVTDSGVGIPAELQERIFEPFFTTKGEEGTGLGLATCYGIVRQAGGDLRVESSPGRGSTFSVLLPYRVDETKPESTSDDRVPNLRGLSVLVVEDRAPILSMMVRCLREQSAEVNASRSAEEALASLEDAPPPDLLITDMILPRMNGAALAERLRSAHPSLPVVFISGRMDEPTALVDGRTTFLTKPFTATQLLHRLGALLFAISRASLDLDGVGRRQIETQESQ